MPIDLLLIGKEAGLLLVKPIGKKVFNYLFPIIDRVRKEASHKTAQALEADFPSGNFVEMNFRFDSPQAKMELEKLVTGRGSPDSVVLEKLMVQELRENWPNFSAKAELIVGTFLKYFEEGCLSRPELQGLTLASLIKVENTATQHVVREQVGALEKTMIMQFDQIKDEIRALSTSEIPYKKLATFVEREYIEERDEILAHLRSWRGEGLHTRIEKLAKKAEGVVEHIDKEISGSIFRLASSSYLRSFNNIEAAKYWLNMAHMVEPENMKTIALQAEILCSEKKWTDAKDLLEPISEKAQEPYVKIMYAECLAHFSGFTAGYEWLKKYDTKQEDDEIKLNIAILATRAGQDDYALSVFDELKKKASPGPYPYLYAASIYIEKATPRDLVTISTSIDIELRTNKQLLSIAADELSKGIELLHKGARSAMEIGHALINLSKVYLALGDTSLAQKKLRKEWKVVREESEAWFTGASIAVARDHKRRALLMARYALHLAGKDDIDSLLRYAVICMQAAAWDDALGATEKTLQRTSGPSYKKAALQIKAYCQLERGLEDLLEETIAELRSKFPKDESWVLTKTISLLKHYGSREALEFLEKEYTNLPISIPTNLLFAGLLHQNKLYEKALPLYKEIAFQTQNPGVFDMTVMVALEAKLPENALSILDQAEGIGIVSDKFVHYRAIALALSKEYEPAIKLFVSLPEASLTGNDLLLYADSWEQRADPERAIAILEKGLERYPADVRLCRKLLFLYLETNRPEKALEQAVKWLEIDPDDRGAYFAVMMTGFPLGAKSAGRALSDYLARFGEGPELRRGTVEDIKKFTSEKQPMDEMLWKQYQDGQLPEAVLGNRSKYGIGGTRLLLLLYSNQRIMAFKGDVKSQWSEFVSLLEAKKVVLDYHALITAFLLKMLEPLFQIANTVVLHETVLRELREDLVMLQSFHQERRCQVLKNVLSRIQRTFKVHDVFMKPNLSTPQENFNNSHFDLLSCKAEQCVYVTPGFETREDVADSDKYGVDIISVLDLLDLLKETGSIPVARYETVLSNIPKYKISSLKKLDSAPQRLMIDWYALEMLEEQELLEDVIPKLSKELHIGPFSYVIIKSEVEEFQKIAEIIQTLRDIESFVGTAVGNGRIRISTTSERLGNNSVLSKGRQFVKHLRELKETCVEQSAILWTDDLCTNTVMTTEGVKTVGTRTVLDFLTARRVLSRQEFVENVAQLIKWNMFFCWVNAEIILTCAEMYSYALSDSLRALLNPTLGEIGAFETADPQGTDTSHFRVWSEVVADLWLKSPKAQNLAVEIFDLLYGEAKKNKLTSVLWIGSCLYRLATLGDVPLAEFLQRLALRMTEMLPDKLEILLEYILESKVGVEKSLLLSADSLLTAKINVLRAAKTALPGLYPKLKKLAIELNPQIKALM